MTRKKNYAKIHLRKRKKGGKNMFDKLLFKAKVVSQGKSLADVSAYLHINYANLYRKINGESDFYRDEIQSLCEFLNIAGEERNKIFFAQEIT